MNCVLLLEEKMNDLQEVVKKQQEVINTLTMTVQKLTTDLETAHNTINSQQQTINDIAAVQGQHHDSISNLSAQQQDLVDSIDLVYSIDSKVETVNDEITTMQETVSTLTHKQQSFNIHMHTISKFRDNVARKG